MAIEKVELKDALNALVTNTNIDKVTGVLGGVPSNISKADLASVMVGLMNSNKLFPYMNKGSFTGDADTLYGPNKSGVYTIVKRDVNDVINTPANVYYGILLVNGGDNSFTEQRLINVSSGESYFRVRSDVKWSSWQRIDNFGYNTLADLSSAVAGQMGVLSLSGNAISIKPGEEVMILPSYAYGLIVLNNASSGRTSIIASDSHVLTDSSILYNGIGLSTDLTATSKICVNRKSVNGEVFLKNNTSTSCNLYAKCVQA